MGKNNNILFILLTGVLALVGVLLYRKTSSAASSAPSTGSNGIPLNSIPVTPAAFTEVFTGGAPTQGLTSQQKENTSLYYLDGTQRGTELVVDIPISVPTKVLKGTFKDSEKRDVEITFTAWRGITDKLDDACKDLKRNPDRSFKESSYPTHAQQHTWKEEDYRGVALKYNVELSLIRIYCRAYNPLKPSLSYFDSDWEQRNKIKDFINSNF